MVAKKKWKRIDVSAVHESLVENNIAQNVASAGISEAMLIDTIGEAPSKKLAKKIGKQKIDGTLANRGVVERAKLQKLVSRIKAESGRIDIDDANDRKRNFDDIWGDDGIPAVKRRPKMPNIAKIIPAVAAPHAGQSYNPTPEAHEELINVAIEAMPKEVEISDEPLTDMIKEALPTVDVDTLSFKQKQVLGNLIVQDKLDQDSIEKALEEMENTEEDSEDEEMDASGTSRTRRLRKKTRAQRNRQKLHKEAIAKALMRKRIKKLVHDIDHMKQINQEQDTNDVDKQEIKRKKLRHYLESLVKGTITPRFGNKSYKAEVPVVALSDEIKTCLRQLETPARSSVDHVMDSIYRRGLVPARPVIDDHYRMKTRNKLTKKTMKYKSKLLQALFINISGNMFKYFVVEDLISLEVGEYLCDAQGRLSNKVDDKYVDKVIAGIGLVILVDELSVLSEPKILPNDASALFTLKLKLLVFAPERNQIIKGKVISADAQGIRVSLGFFSDVMVIPQFMPKGSVYDKGQWYTQKNETKVYYKVDSEIDLEVVEISYNELNGKSRGYTNNLMLDMSTDVQLPVMLVIATPKVECLK
ncbi:DNA-directed RNA polymerase [Babesia ovis]|uniref:Ribosome biogenesis protein NOP53 n=1 Tax=Babesia ovis TaxID=5869 RepID=A0A9W5WTU1_BABOV|nr:DNA-directed RNA polymerase [Babesia ovis]